MCKSCRSVGWYEALVASGNGLSYLYELLLQISRSKRHLDKASMLQCWDSLERCVCVCVCVCVCLCVCMCVLMFVCVMYLWV